MLFDYLVTGGIIEVNPAASVKGPRIIICEGKTHVLSAEEARELLDSIDVTKIAGLRDRALIGMMVFSFARIGASVTMNVDDVFQSRRKHWIRLHEKGGKFHEMPLHHNAEEYLLDYIVAAGIANESSSPLFRTLDRKRALTENRLTRQDAWGMVKCRAQCQDL